MDTGPPVLSFAQTFALPPSLEARFSFVGVVESSGDYEPVLDCIATSGGGVTPGGVTWWISPIG
jgi:hypothetical protein